MRIRDADMELESVRGECGYCGERVREKDELWLPLECTTCHQFFHLRCLKVGGPLFSLTLNKLPCGRVRGPRNCAETVSGFSPALSATHTAGSPVHDHTYSGKRGVLCGCVFLGGFPAGCT